MQIEWTWLRSTVARHLLFIFLCYALLPIAALSFVAFDHVTEQLYEQSHRRLHGVSKTAALEVLSRLQDLDVALGELAARAGGEGRSGLERGARALRDRLGALALVPADAPPTALFGEPPDFAPPTGSAQAHPANGKATLVFTRDAAGPKMLMARRLDPAQDTLLVARIDLERLLDISPDNVLPPAAEFCVLDPHGVPIRCSLEGSPEIPPQVVAELGDSASGSSTGATPARNSSPATGRST